MPVVGLKPAQILPYAYDIITSNFKEHFHRLLKRVVWQAAYALVRTATVASDMKHKV